MINPVLSNWTTTQTTVSFQNLNLISMELKIKQTIYFNCSNDNNLQSITAKTIRGQEKITL